MQPVSQRRAGRVLMAAACGVMFSAESASAIPLLQIYIEGASFNTISQAWSTRHNQFKLWVIGDVGRGGPVLGGDSPIGSILDVKLAAVFATNEAGSISLTPIVSTDPRITDKSAPSAVGTPLRSTEGAVPVRNDGIPINTAGVFGTGKSFFQWELGTMANSAESAIGDFQSSFPDVSEATDFGEVFAYQVDVTGYASGLRFLTYNHVDPPPTIASFNPTEATTPVPEADSLVILGIGLSIIVAVGAERRKRMGI